MGRKASRIIPQNKQPIGKRLKSETELAAQLQEAVKPLQLLNMIDTTEFTPLGLTVECYIRRTRVFLSISSDPIVLKETALAAARAGVYDLSIPAQHAGWKLSPLGSFQLITFWLKLCLLNWLYEEFYITIVCILIWYVYIPTFPGANYFYF